MTTFQAQRVADGFTLLEAPRWAYGALWVSDFFSERVLRFPGPVDGRFETVCPVPGQPSGLWVTGPDEVVVVSMLGRELLRWDGKELSELADLSQVSGPANDLVRDTHGRAYVGNFGLVGGEGTDLAPTELLCVEANGEVRAVADDVVFPNGMVLTADGRTLLVAETYRGVVTAFAVADDGGLGDRRVWADLTGGAQPPLEIGAATEALPVLPDGLCLDAEGALWIADAKGHGITRVAEGGRAVDFVETGDVAVYAAALGGPSLTTLFLCCAPPVETFDPRQESRSVLMTCEVDVPGLSGPTG